MKMKIRNDIDLKKLEKYGFEYEDMEEDSYYFYDLHDNRTYITVGCIDRIIGISTALMGDIPAYYIENLGILYDLFEANLIEEETNENEKRNKI